MPSNLSEKDLNELIEDLLMLANALATLRSDKFSGVARRAVKAIDELQRIIKERMKGTS